MTLIVIQFQILMAELDPFHLVQLLLFLRELFHPQLGDLVVPFFEALSIVHVKDPLSDFLVDLPEKLLLDPSGGLGLLEFFFGLIFLIDDFIRLPLIVEQPLSTKLNQLLLTLRNGLSTCWASKRHQLITLLLQFHVGFMTGYPPLHEAGVAEEMSIIHLAGAPPGV